MKVHAQLHHCGNCKSQKKAGPLGLVMLWVFSLFFLASGSAQAQSCDPGSYQCGSNWCTPNDRVCCASVGRPDANCPQGSTCMANGCTSSGGGGDRCGSGQTECSGGCMPSGSVCCSGHYCPGGSSCTADGCSGGGGGGGGSCAAGQVACSGGCMPAGSVCCSNHYCPSGSSCTADGCGGGSGGGGTSAGGCNNNCETAYDGDCDDGGSGAAYNLCGLGTDCADCGRRSSGSSSSSGSDGLTCHSESVTGCDIMFCTDAACLEAHYIVNGERVNCNGCDVSQCAQVAGQICAGGQGSAPGSYGPSGGGGSAAGGCSAPASDQGEVPLLPTICLLLAGIGFRRRRK